MTWTSAFDIGPCNVNILFGGGSQLSQIMAKGDSVDFMAFGDDSYTAAVSSDGVVSITNNSSDSNPVQVGIEVMPSYAIGTMGLRARSCVIPSAVFTNAIGYTNFSTEPSVVTFTSLSPVAPEPCDLSAITDDHNLIGIQAEFVS
jgi:hypothetical protein